MKVSNYNLFVPYEEDKVLLGYNCVSGGLYVFGLDQKELIHKILQNPDNFEDGNSDGLKKKLINGRFVLESNIDELRMLKVRTNISRYNPNLLGLVVCWTGGEPLLSLERKVSHEKL